jgi:hypothetical protein
MGYWVLLMRDHCAIKRVGAPNHPTNVAFNTCYGLKAVVITCYGLKAMVITSYGLNAMVITSYG